jgi:hypothetical protein
MQATGEVQAGDATERPPAAIIREQIREQLRGSFERFLELATEEEKWFLADVFGVWESCQGSNDPAEVIIASAFEQEIRTRGQYLLIPGSLFGEHQLTKAIRRFVRDCGETGGTLEWAPGEDGRSIKRGRVVTLKANGK